MKNFALLFLVLILSLPSYCQHNYLEGNTTPTYAELIDFYTKMANENSDISLFNMGTSDSREPIYLCVLGADLDSTKTFENCREHTTLLINNAIHPGEPCGVNASMQLVQDYTTLSGADRAEMPYVAIIPAYNVGGALNRNTSSRANQEGPDEYGFRGNTRNFDLNRDFIKMDSKNMFTFAKIYHALDPDVFVDTHTSNGADYQYTITYIASLKDRMNPVMRDLMYDDMIPSLNKRIKKSYDYDLFPYIEMVESRIDGGINAFNDLPRYSMGYTNLFNTFSFTTETHMLKSFPERVRSTFAFLDELIHYTAENSEVIEQSRRDAFDAQIQEEYYHFNYAFSGEKDSILFSGYEYSDEPSSVTTQTRLKYHREQPFQRYIPFHSSFVAKDSVRIPTYYVVKGSEEAVINRLIQNGVELEDASEFDDEIVYWQKIEDYTTGNAPYEGHYLHKKTSSTTIKQNYSFQKGDVFVSTNQKKVNFIVSVLDARCEDSYFNWNFFDSYLQQKEYFSPYVFEEKAAEVLANDEHLAKEFRIKQKEDKAFASSRWSQLYFLYQHSDYYEPTHKVLPIGMIY